MNYPSTATTAALVGIGARLPGPDGVDVCGPHQMWQAVQAGKTAIGRYPAQRWQAMQHRLHPQDRGQDPWPAALITWPTPTDHRLWGLRASETSHLSPTQILILQVVAEALADAGIRPDTLAGPRTGIYLGFSSPDDALDVFADQARPTLLDLAAGGAGMAATPVSRWLNARGPLVTYDTSCSASMYALHAARRDLADGTVTTAIVIGVNVLNNPVPTRAFRQGGVLADDGDVRPFDAHAHGYARGEAVVAAVLRPYSQARADQDRIYTLLGHTVVGSDGRSPGTGMPSAQALGELVERAHEASGIRTEDVGLVITHGPGTMAGARAEARALHTAYPRTEAPLPLTSVKGLFGHSEAAAGLTNVLAGALMLHHGGRVPPTTGYSSPPPWLGQYGVRVVDEVTDLPFEPGVHVGVSALGFSGAIAYGLLRPTPQIARPRTGNSPALGGAAVWPLSAPTAGRLQAHAQEWAHATQGERRRPRLGRVGDHLTRRRDPKGAVRTAVVATNGYTDAHQAWQALAQGGHHHDLVSATHGEGPWSPVWVFGGHGAAHPHMGTLLYQQDKLFAEHLDRALQALQANTKGRVWYPTGHLPSNLAQVQRATWAMQVALARTLTDRWGLRPQVVVGHSLGEVAAAHIAGILSLEDAARLVCARADLLDQLTGVGHLLTARLDTNTASQLAQDHRVDLACINSPEHVVFAGSEAALDPLAIDLLDRGAQPRTLSGSPPAHSRHVDQVLAELTAALEGLDPAQGEVEFVSTVTAATTPGRELDAAYWATQLRSTVLWHQTMAVLGRRLSMQVTEISPRPVLATPTAHIRARHGLTMDLVCAGTPDDERRGMALAAAHAYVHDLPMRWPYPASAPVEVDPAPWNAPTNQVVPWTEQVTDLTGPALHHTLQRVVLALVDGLSPRPVTTADLDTDLSDLGLHSIDRLVLADRLLAPLNPRPDHLPDHQPTIRSIATAMEHLRPGQAPSSV